MYFLIAIICLLAMTAFNLAIPKIISSAIDNAISQGDYRYLVYLAIGILGASILRGASAYGRQYFGEGDGEPWIRFAYVPIRIH